MGLIKGVDYTKFNEKQILAIEILSKPGRGGLTYDQVAEYVGVDPKTLYRWRQDPAFVEVVTRKAVMTLHEDLPEVFAANLAKAKRGEVKSVELLYKLIGLLVDKAEVEIEEKGGTNENLADDIQKLKEMLGKK